MPIYLSEGRRSRLQAAGLLVAVFAAGIIAGGAAVAAASGWDRAPGAGTFPVRMIDRLSTELALSPAQQESVRVILDRHAPAFDQLRSTVRAEIRILLTPEQQDRYARMLERLDREREAQWGTSDKR